MKTLLFGPQHVWYVICAHFLFICIYQYVPRFALGVFSVERCVTPYFRLMKHSPQLYRHRIKRTEATTRSLKFEGVSGSVHLIQYGKTLRDNILRHEIAQRYMKIAEPWVV